MSVFARCDFSGDVATTLLDAHTTADLTPHPTWTKNTGGAGTLAISSGGRVRATSSSTGIYYANETPIDADYTVLGTLRCVSNASSSIGWLIARHFTGVTITGYVAGFSLASAGWVITKYVSNTATNLVTTAATLTVGQDYALQFEVEGTALRLFVDGGLTCSATDSAIAGVGKAGVRMAVGSDSTGYHIDNWSADDVVLSTGTGGTTSSGKMLLLGAG